ncbi:MAG: hypothetical protein ABH842_03930 [Candidatus Micrarchaeota archaeon]
MPETRIRKKIYNFDIRKKYHQTVNYKIKERPPIEKIKDAIKTFIKPPKKQEKKETRALPEPPKGGFSFGIFGAFALIAIIILAVGWIYLTTQVLAPGTGLTQEEMERPTIENMLIDGSILMSGQKNTPTHIAGVVIDYKTSNIDNYTINITTFNQKIPTEIFILNSEKLEADSYPDFLYSLRTELKKRNLMLNEITIRQLETLPQGGIVIVPSGVIPKEMLGIDSLVSMDKLADRGIVVIYLGQKFTKILDGTLVTDTPTSVVSSLPVTFDETSPISPTQELHIYQPLYLVNARSKWTASTLYGGISVIKKGDGAFLFFPQTLDGGWRGNYTSAANDVSNVIFKTAWISPSSNTKTYYFENQDGYNGTSYFFSETFQESNTTVKVEFTGYSEKVSTPIKEMLFKRIELQTPNQMFIESSGNVVPTNISDSPVRINALLREPVPSQPSMSIIIEDINGTDMQTLPQGNVNVQADRSFDIRVYVEKGEYLVNLEDDNGKEYAQTYMKVITPEVTYIGGVKDKPSVYRFYVTMDDEALKLSQITVKVDDGRFGEYSFSNSEYLDVNVGSYTGNDRLPIGETHKFEFTSGKLTTVVDIPHPRMSTPLENPVVWLVIIFTGGIMGVGMVFARQEETYYSLDIPDFPPITKTKIPLQADVILNLFDKVNENYRWENTPLTPGEIKNAFKQVLHQGKPIYITDYNVEFILQEMEKRDLVKESLGYYGKVNWEGQSKRTIEYLAMMRKIRDICVNNAIPFTLIGEAKNSDTVLTVMGQQMYIHIYEKGIKVEDFLTRLLTTIKSGITIIVFKNNSDKSHFQNIMNSTASTVPLIIKMEAESSSIIYQTSDELEKMIVEFKSM